MSETTFVDRVKTLFGFLESNYGFKTIKASVSENMPRTDGEVRYESDRMVVSVNSDMGCVAIKFWRITDGSRYYLTPIDVHEYLNTTVQEKELLLSTDRKDEQAARLLFNEKFLLNQPDWEGSRGHVIDLEKDLQSFSNWLMQHGQLCFGMSISEWALYYEYKIRRTQANCLRTGQNETTHVGVKGPDGKWVLVKQSIFKENLEYIDKLKKELSGSF